MAARRPAKGRPEKARPEKVQPSLMEVALTKLDHRDRTKQQLRQLLTRKAAERTGSADDGEASAESPAVNQQQIDEVLSRLEASGVINDHRYAEHYVRSARARGASRAKVQQMLGRRGVERKSVEEALGTLAVEGLDELAAAKSYAKRRRLAERYDLSDPKERQKALASLARQGFSSSTALLALGTDDDRSDVDPDDV